MLYIKAGIQTILVGIANRETLIRSSLIWVCAGCPVFFSRQLAFKIIEHLPLLLLGHSYICKQFSIATATACMLIKCIVHRLLHHYQTYQFDLLTVPKRCSICGSFLLFMFHVMSLLYCLVCSLQPCDHLLGQD